MPVTVEAHLLDADLDLYGKRLRIGFTKRLRAEERFASADALVAQIHQDIAATRLIFASRTGS
jgi:riboflavin kinase / FMN adenylyltransferase